MKNAILFGPCIGEFYWELARFAPLLPYYRYKKYKKKDIVYIILTRKERFDLYGKYANILIPLEIENDYNLHQPNCFRLDGFKEKSYLDIVNAFNAQYSKQFKIVEHLFPNVSKRQYLNKQQFNQKHMIFKFKPRNDNSILVDNYLPKDKPIIGLAPRYRSGFKRNWNSWPKFYDMLSKDRVLMDNFNFIICGKSDEYIPDTKCRFYDMNDIKLSSNSSTSGVLLEVLNRIDFVFGSQSAIPNLALLYKKEVLEFGHQKYLHTKTYNIFNTPITFIKDENYNIDVNKIFSVFKSNLQRGRIKWKIDGS